MRTPDEVLDKYTTTLTDGTMICTRASRISAIKEYSMEQSIDFGTWLSKSFTPVDKNEWYAIPYSGRQGNYTTEQLFELYLKEQQ